MNLVITEGTASMWHYHLSKADATARGLCGAETMRTALRPQQWRTMPSYHVPYSWCSKCDAARIAREQGEA